MDGLDCPTCGSDDVRGEQNRGGTITLTCQSCQASWDRVPEPSCPRCGRSDVEEYGIQDRVDDDPAAANTDPAASGRSRGGRTFRCRRCHNTWGRPGS
jgi:transposase-like protein